MTKDRGAYEPNLPSLVPLDGPAVIDGAWPDTHLHMQAAKVNVPVGTEHAALQGQRGIVVMANCGSPELQGQTVLLPYQARAVAVQLLANADLADFDDNSSGLGESLLASLLAGGHPGIDVPLEDTEDVIRGNAFQMVDADGDILDLTTANGEDTQAVLTTSTRFLEDEDGVPVEDGSWSSVSVGLTPDQATRLAERLLVWAKAAI